MNPIVPFDSSALMPLMPMLILSVTMIVVMIAIAMRRSNVIAGTISVIGLNTALGVLLVQLLGASPTSLLHGIYGAFSPSQGLVSSLFVVDSFAQFNMVIVLVCALACFTLAYG